MSKKNNVFLSEEKLEYQSLDFIMSDRFGRYSKYIIQQRALPDVRDGLKPVQRRILYSMHTLGLQHNKAFKKSARIVGDVIGKYHPHGDSSIYEALVRMSQDWKTNIPLVEMHGNKGSIDDDPAAAMRYTETRLSKIASLMLNEIDKETVLFSTNFDDSEEEPVVLPSYLPNLLVNGAKGIASGFAADIPPHNLNEVIDASIAKIKNSNISSEEIQKYIKGPDFPTGGIINGNKGIKQAFETGSGRVQINSKYEVISKNKNSIIKITEIPYGVVKAKLVKEIDETRIVNELHSIKEIKDESDRDGISIVIYLQPDADPKQIMDFLFKKTELSVYYSYNMVAIVNKAPKLIGIKGLLNSYISFVKEIKTASTIFELKKATKKLEILIGLIRVTEISDEVIQTIREATGGKPGVILALQEKLKFTLIQATAISEMRLYRLNRTDAEIYLRDKEELERKIEFYKRLIDDENFFNKNLIKILNEIKTEFGQERKTQIFENELTININEEKLIKTEDCYVGITSDGYIKRFSPRIHDANEIKNYTIKENDSLIFLSKTQTTNKLLCFTKKGMYALVPVFKINECKYKDLGKHLSDFVSDFEASDEIVSVIDIQDWNTNAYVVLVTKMGMGKKIKISDLEFSRISKISKAIVLKKNDDYLVNAKISNGKQNILIITNTSHSIKFHEDNIPILGNKSSGNIMIKLKHNWVNDFVLANEDEKVIFITKNKTYKVIDFHILAIQNKATKGNILFKELTKNTFIILVNKINGSEIIFNDPENLNIKMLSKINLTIGDLEKRFNKIKENYKNIKIFENIKMVDDKNIFPDFAKEIHKIEIISKADDIDISEKEKKVSEILEKNKI